MQNMGINKLANMFMGNPQPLAARVDQAQRQTKPGQLPPDLEQAIALQKIQELQQAAQNQQAMQAGGQQPTIVEKLRQMMQPQPQMQGQPQGGMPPQMAQGPQGINQLPTQFGLAGGGIVAFADGGGVSDELQSLQEARERYVRANADTTAIDQAIAKLSSEMRPVMQNDPRMNQSKELANNPNALQQPTHYQSSPGSRGYDRPAGVPPSTIENDVYELTGFRGTRPPNVSDKAWADYVAKNGIPQHTGTSLSQNDLSAYKPRRYPEGLAATPAAAQLAAPRPANPRPAAPTPPPVTQTAAQQPAAPSDVDAYLRKRFAVDEEAKGAAAEAKARAAYGAPSTEGYDRAVEELKRRQAQFAAPATGMPALMEYLQQIASAPRGVGSLTAGAMGAQKVTDLQQAREAQQFDLAKQILDQEQKKADVTRGYAKEMYGVNAAAIKEAGDQAYNAAIALHKSEDEAKKLKQEAELRTAEMLSTEKRTAGSNAATIAAANIGAAGRADSGGAKATIDAFKTRLASIDRELAPLMKMPFGANKDAIASLQAEKSRLTRAMDAATGIGTMDKAPDAKASAESKPGWGKASVVK
jgi:hypothetical protein